jgi:hypothetical protein
MDTTRPLQQWTRKQLALTPSGVKLAKAMLGVVILGAAYLGVLGLNLLAVQYTSDQAAIDVLKLEAAIWDKHGCGPPNRTVQGGQAKSRQ